MKISIQEKKAGNNSDSINEEIVAKAEKLTENECIFTKQHKLLLSNCLSKMKNMK